MIEPQGMRWMLAVFLAVGSFGCAGAGAGPAGPNLVTGRISPAHFRFEQTVPKDKDPSGWRAVCIYAMMTNGDTGARLACAFEVGVPVRNRDRGEISLEAAQVIAAAWANQAAYEVLSNGRPGEPLAVLCLQFRQRYRELLRQKLAGAEVSACTSGLTPVIFDLSPALPSLL